MIAENVEIWNTDAHDITDIMTGEVINSSMPVKIGNDVWLGKNSTILKGVTIADGAIIGMGAVITKNVPKSSITVGVDKLVKSGVEWSHSWTKR